MSERDPMLVLVDPGERLPLAVGGSTLYYRRLSLGALAALERAHTEWPAPAPGQAPRPVLNRAALEAACLAHVLVGWDNVAGPAGRPVGFSPAAARRLPGGVRELILRRAREARPPTPQPRREP
jgi:hypothetical protein